MPDRLAVVAPALGVRMGREGGDEVLHATDEGGRGYPWEVVLIGVNVDRQAAAIDWPKPHDIAQVSRCVQRDKMGSYRVRIDGNCPWPAGGTHVLVLMVYVLFAHGGDRNGPPPYADAELIAAIEAALTGSDSLERLQSGLIVQAAQAAPAPAAGRPPQQAPSRPGRAARSAPHADASDIDVTVAIASCHFPHDILDRMPQRPGCLPGPADAVLCALADRIDERSGAARPSLLLLCGDQIYADATAGLFDPALLDDRYTRPYELLLGSVGAQRVLQRRDLVVHMLPDDHEISDNWQPGDVAQAALEEAMKSYWKYQRQGADPSPRVWQGPLRHRGLEYFLADTRTEREPRLASDLRTRHIMHAEQWGVLLDWLKEGPQQPKLIATASMLLPRRLSIRCDESAALYSDSWDGYPASLHALLRFVCRERLNDIVFVSGDEHLSCLARAELYEGSELRATLHSIHSSALYAPYPFANAAPEVFAGEETFAVDPADGDDRPVTCRVSTRFAAPGDGFALARFERHGGHGALGVEFHGAAGLKPSCAHRIDLAP